MNPLNKKPMVSKHKFRVYEGATASNNAEFNQVNYFQAKITKQLGEETWQLENRKIVQRAFSCLIQPQVGDTVVCVSHDDKTSITAILERTELETNTTKLSLSQDTELELSAKKLSLLAKTEMELTSAGDMSLNSAFGKLFMLSTDLIQQIQHSFIQTCKQFISRTEYTDMQAKEMLKSHSRNQIMTADKDIRVDAERINMG